MVFWASSAAANRKPSSPKKAKKAMKIKNKNKTAITTVTIVLTIVVHFAYRHIKNRPTGKKKIKIIQLPKSVHTIFQLILLHPLNFSLYLLFRHLIAYLPYIILCLYFFVHLFLIEHK